MECFLKIYLAYTSGKEPVESILTEEAKLGR